MIESKLFRSIHSHLNHITWFRNSASVSLLATYLHRTWVANDFSSSQLFQKRSKISDCTFWKFSYKRKFSFSLISCMRNRHSTVIEDYIKRDDVIRYELDLALIITAAKVDISHKSLSRNALISSHRSLSRSALVSFHRSLSRDVFIKREAIRSLERHEIERTCLWSVI
jgi:hypothetical protein